MFKANLLIFALVTAAAAQSSSSPASSTARPSSSITGSATGTAISSPAIPSGLSTCILGCVVPAATQNNCSSVADLQCVCSSAQFQADAQKCLSDNCTPAEVQTAKDLQQAQCGNIGVSPSGASATPRPISSGATGPGGSAPAPTAISPTTGTQTQQSSAPTNAASSSAVNGVWALAAALFGIVAAF